MIADENIHQEANLILEQPSVRCIGTVVPYSKPTLTLTPGDAQMSLAWGKVTGCSGYRVWGDSKPIVQTSNTYMIADESVLTDDDATTLLDTGLTQNTRYFYKVAAIDSGEVEGEPSDSKSDVATTAA